jgi:hypothetical protein
MDGYFDVFPFIAAAIEHVGGPNGFGLRLSQEWGRRTDVGAGAEQTE